MNTLKEFLKIIFTFYWSLFILRLLELFLILKNHGVYNNVILLEGIGFLNDLLQSIPFLLLLLLIFAVIFKFHKKAASFIAIAFIIIWSIFHTLILKYFSYQLDLLDTFLFKHSFKEVTHTIHTAEINYSDVIIYIIILVGIIPGFYKLIKSINIPVKQTKWIYAIILLFIPLNFFARSLSPLKTNHLIINKSIYFYTRSFNYFQNKKKLHNTNYESNQLYQQIFDSHEYIDIEYPALHKFDNRDVIGPFIKETDTIPNIVILIVEGLNDDFLYPFKDVQLMPFLTNLSKQSLYWNKCFTLGERSFAVMPSLLGGLPHGEIGFTLLDKYPFHYSLVSVLKSNHYYTSFFYGQGSWFHEKAAFFKYNNIDLIIDNTKFSSQYKKIVTEKEKFFWGYNDKDLFNQSLDVIDSLTESPRLDLYFTGTSHSPFAISNEAYYSTRFNKLLKQIKKDNDKHFFNTYKKYIKSILFVDDALRDFFSEYQKREDFDHTLFIITGDHPVTEIPIKNSLKRYHVPLLIYSKMIEEPRTFSGAVSHLDIYETILAYLSTNYNLHVPEYSSSLGEKLNTTTNNLNRNIAFMNTNREIVDFFSNGYYLSGENLYQVGQQLDIFKINNDSILNDIQRKRKIFKETNHYLSTQNKILPPAYYCSGLRHKLIYNEFIPSVQTKNEYYTLIDHVSIPCQQMIYEISCNYKKLKNSETSIVYQLTNKQDSILFWKNQQVSEDSQSLHFRVNIPKQRINDTTIFFKSFIWNKTKQKIDFFDINLMIYDPQTMGNNKNFILNK